MKKYQNDEGLNFEDFRSLMEFIVKLFKIFLQFCTSQQSLNLKGLKLAFVSLGCLRLKV